MKKSRLKSGSCFLWPFYSVNIRPFRSMMTLLVISLASFQLQAKAPVAAEKVIRQKAEHTVLVSFPGKGSRYSCRTTTGH